MEGILRQLRVWLKILEGGCYHRGRQRHKERTLHKREIRYHGDIYSASSVVKFNDFFTVLCVFLTWCEIRTSAGCSPCLILHLIFHVDKGADGLFGGTDVIVTEGQGLAPRARELGRDTLDNTHQDLKKKKKINAGSRIKRSRPIFFLIMSFRLFPPDIPCTPGYNLLPPWSRRPDSRVPPVPAIGLQWAYSPWRRRAAPVH